jgi:uncharacterized protein
MPLEELVQQKRAEIAAIAAKHGVQSVWVVGSVARGDSRDESDLDLLVTPGPRTSSWFPGGLISDLEALLHRRVQVVTEAGLRPELRESVLRDARPL